MTGARFSAGGMQELIDDPAIGHAMALAALRAKADQLALERLELAALVPHLLQVGIDEHVDLVAGRVLLVEERQQPPPRFGGRGAAPVFEPRRRVFSCSSSCEIL